PAVCPDEWLPPPLHQQYGAPRGTVRLSPPDNPPVRWRWRNPAEPLPGNVDVSPECRPAPAPPYAGSPARYRARRTDLLCLPAYLCCKPAANLSASSSCRLTPPAPDRIYRESAPAHPGFSSAALMMNRKSRGQKAPPTPLRRC